MKEVFRSHKIIYIMIYMMIKVVTYGVWEIMRY
jgi:hypothetical protein